MSYIVFSQREMEVIFLCLNGVSATPATLYENIVCSEAYEQGVLKGAVTYGTSPVNFQNRLQSLTDVEAQDIIDTAKEYWIKR